MAKMILKRYRVFKFRSVDDSGWIELSQVTSMIGINESGKTNLLLPLWKFNPAKDGEIIPTSDYPRKEYNAIRSAKKKPVFIKTEFLLSDELAAEIAELSEIAPSQVKFAEVSKTYDEEYFVQFPYANSARHASKARILEIADFYSSSLKNAKPTKSEEGVHGEMVSHLEEVLAAATSFSDEKVNLADFERLFAGIESSIQTMELKASEINPIFAEYKKKVVEMRSVFRKQRPTDIAEVRQKIIDNLPTFVYYSNYGNLDSEIYLPHVLENLDREDLGAKEAAKARTLKVLFDFVKLSPKEILALGETKVPTDRKPTEAEIETEAGLRMERDILLQSASTELTKRFRDWWKQGEYRFRFQADGNHFRIWVSDDRRPEDIELEGRSAGLQWFLSFYLIFLVESQDSHLGSVLLLDEPGLSLHPLAQKDLLRFFQGLSKTNRLIFTTHSPFLIDSNHLDWVKAVYVDDAGHTRISEDLKRSGGGSNQDKSIYPVYASLGLSVSTTLLMGCKIIIVAGPSEQYYLNAIKSVLISTRAISPAKEIVFLPAGGARGIKSAIAILGIREDDYPYVLVDDDEQGRNLSKNLTGGLYSQCKERVVKLDQITGRPGSGIEDLLPFELLSKTITKYLRGPEEDFQDVADPDGLVIEQVEAYARKHNLALEKPGWKADVAKLVKAKILSRIDMIPTGSAEFERCKSLFQNLGVELN